MTSEPYTAAILFAVEHEDETYNFLTGLPVTWLPVFTGNTESPVAFADVAKLDLRLPAGSPAIKAGCYPQGEVPGVTLGILP